MVYFSSASGNTARFVAKLGWPVERVPLHRRPGAAADDPGLTATGPFVLIVPTYGGGQERTAVPPQVIRFLNEPGNRAALRGVVAAGNTNFGAAYGLAGDIIAAKCQVPCLAKFELMGTPADVERVREGLTKWWGEQ
ncbi:MAG: class Ib ribonucleoside-diphosphate reductase assembly flavoprotein NrdI [Bifidobacteriaceae bacterium]|nr:class Ib ribonucleoside-diphosphate reductase assembly flavoprotein NrdI [Bifidobacteriaceae bacterium]